MSEQFKWNDEYVKQFVAEVILGKHESCQSAIEKFKESKQPKPEWEIVSFKGNESGAIMAAGSQQCGDAYLLKHPEMYFIYQVKRLSDSEIFTIGDKVEAYKDKKPTIRSFELTNDNRMKVFTNEVTGFWWLRDINKIFPLFKTEDGVSIYEGMEYWYVTDYWSILDSKAGEGCGSVKMYKYFSTKDKATNWIIENKPCLSYNDIKDFLYRNEVNHVEQIIKDKLKQADSQ